MFVIRFGYAVKWAILATCLAACLTFFVAPGNARLVKLDLPYKGKLEIETSSLTDEEFFELFNGGFMDRPKRADITQEYLDRKFGQLERKYDARLGVYAHSALRSVLYRSEERFAFGSTFKALAAGLILQRKTSEELDKVIHFKSTDLITWSPVTEEHVDTEMEPRGMKLRDLMEAAVRHSDNTAANLLLAELGGPAGFQEALDDLGDNVTHSDRNEPGLGETAPGDIRDTSTPRALAVDLSLLVFGDLLPPEKRALLTDWLKRNEAPRSGELIRAGVPAGWIVGDKTGAAEYGTRNDIGIIWPPDGIPIAIAIMSSRATKDAKYNNALIAEATKIVVEIFG